MVKLIDVVRIPATPREIRIPIALLAPQASANPGNSFWTVTGLTDYDAGHWQFVAATWDHAGDNTPYLYRGTPGVPIAEMAYFPGNHFAGVGVLGSDSAQDKYIGNESGTVRTFDGRIAHLLWFNRVLSVNEMAHLQSGRLITTGLIGYWPLWGVATPEADLSGNGNNGAVVGATVYDHAPIGPSG